MAEQKKDIVERLRGCTDKKYPGFQNLNTEAADAITRLREEMVTVSTKLQIVEDMLKATTNLYKDTKAELELALSYEIKLREERNRLRSEGST